MVYTKNKVSRFGRRVIHSYEKRGFTGAIISGEFSKGKTATAMYMATEILMYLYNLNKLDAMRYMLKHFIFTLDDMVDLTANTLGTINEWADLTPTETLRKKHKIRKPVVIWDDAGIHASSQQQRFNPGEAWELQSNYDQIRDVTSCMILTVPEASELMSFLKKYRAFYYIEIIRPSSGGEYDRVLEFWKYKKDSLNRNKLKLQWRTPRFSVYVPNEIYGAYDKMRTIAKIKHTKTLQERKKQKEIERKYHQLKQEKELIEMEKFINKHS